MKREKEEEPNDELGRVWVDEDRHITYIVRLAYFDTYACAKKRTSRGLC